MNHTEHCKEQAKALVAQMTIDERASQLTYNSPAIERLSVPAYNWWNEALHGVARAGTATSFPQAIGLAAIFDEDFLKEVADMIATEGRAKYNQFTQENDRGIYKGLTFWSPNVNIFRDPRWGRGHETYGEDPYLSARLGVAFIQGLQGDGEVMKSAACAKHFAVHSGPEALRHEFDAVVSEKDLRETYLPAFDACIHEGAVESVMGAYNRTNGEPCCGSYRLLRDILRDEWGFDGHVVSDCWALKDFHLFHHVTPTASASAALAIDAGCDLNCGNIYLYILQALRMGLITEAHITRAAERLFTTRFKLGLFGESEFDAIPYTAVECPEHIQKSVDAAAKSMVLLENDGILPLNKEKLATIGVIGPNANSRLALKGNYYGTSSRYITILEGIQDEVGDGARVLYAKGCEMKKDRTEPLAEVDDRIAEALAVAKCSDVIILCLGLDETLEGEEGDEGNAYASGDKDDLEFPAVQKKLMEAVAQTGKPVILCNMTGSAMNLAYAQAHFSAILQTWYPGSRGGKAVADILFGNLSPSGKLPVTFYEDLNRLPAFTDYAMDNRTYRYYDGTPLYPFGYGLTYGDVACSELTLVGEIAENEPLTLSVKVENRSETATEDVVQLYLKSHSENEVKNHRLCGFRRVQLNGNESLSVEFTLDYDQLCVVNEDGNRVIDFSTFDVFVGTSQPDDRSATLTGTPCCQLTCALG